MDKKSKSLRKISVDKSQLNVDSVRTSVDSVDLHKNLRKLSVDTSQLPQLNVDNVDQYNDTDIAYNDINSEMNFDGEKESFILPTVLKFVGTSAKWEREFANIR